MTQQTKDDLFGKIAVVGMAGRFPGSEDLSGFWNTLVEGRNCISYFTPEEMIAIGVPAEQVAQPSYIRASGAYRRPFEFDPAFFGYNPREAEIMDPQHRIFLEYSWTALEHAGYDTQRYQGRIGVFGGGGTSNYLFQILGDPVLMGTLDTYSFMTTNEKDFLATRVGYKMDLRGPCVNLQTACSTSLVAIALGAQSLLNFQSDMVLAGGVRVDPYEYRGYQYTEGGINSPDGVCRTFDADAKGTVWANGVGVVVLKRLADAIADRDSIQAVILGFGLSNDGSAKAGFTAPSVEGQFLATMDALSMAAVSPESISYVECHGTATPIGDPIEIAALTKSFRNYTDKKAFCRVGSVKTNIGHTDTAAGVAGFIKTVLSLKHRTLPASLHYNKPNPQIDFENSPFYVNTSLCEWEAEGAPLRACVNAFGMGGTNATVVLEEAPIPAPTSPGHPAELILLSAKSPAALDRMTANLAVYLDREEAGAFPDVAYTLQVGRKVMPFRRFLVSRNARSCAGTLPAENLPGVVTIHKDKQTTAVSFLFPGQGSQYPNMAKAVYEAEPFFREIVDSCCERLNPHLGLDLRELLFTDAEKVEDAARLLEQTAYTQPALFVIEYALARLWMRWGVTPEGMIGHSVGEYVAACLAGVFSLEDALTLIAMRGRLMQDMPGGCMVGVLLPHTEVEPMLFGQPGLAVAAINGPGTCVLSGPQVAVAAIEAEFSSRNVPFRRLKTSHAFHSAMMDPICGPFLELVKTVLLQAPTMPYLSNVTGTWIKAEEATNPEYWVKHLRGTVDFFGGTCELLGKGGKILLEVGPGATLTGLVAQHPEKTPDFPSVASLPLPNEGNLDSYEFILTALGRLWSEGATIDWGGFHTDGLRQRLALPTYPFDHHEYRLSFSPPGASSVDPLKAPKRHDVADWFNVPSWKRTAPTLEPAKAKPGRWLVFSDACGLGDRLRVALEGQGHDLIVVEKGAQFLRREDGRFTVRPGAPEDFIELFRTLRSLEQLPSDIVHLWAVRPLESVCINPEQMDGILESTFYSLLYLCAALGTEVSWAEVNLHVLSSHAYDVAGDGRVSPCNATVAGPGKAVSREQANVRSHLIDVDLPESHQLERWEILVRSLLAELGSMESEEVVAFRNGCRWIPQFEPIKVGASSDARQGLRENGVYLVIGGLGAIGLSLAGEIAAQVRPKLALLSRRGMPPRETWTTWLKTRGDKEPTSQKILKILKMEELGAEVMILAADVADLEQMMAAVGKVKERFGPINGAIHAAGLPGVGIMELKTREAAEKVLGPKVKGTVILDRVLKEEPLDFFVICSSLIGIIGGSGQSDYGAGNSFIGAFVNSSAPLSRVAPVAIDYDRWDEVGMAYVALTGAGSKSVDLEYEEVQHPVFSARFRQMQETTYAAYLNSDQHWIVGEHLLRGQPAMVGTAYIELVRAAFLNEFPGNGAEIRDVVFMGALMMTAEETRECRVILRKQDSESEAEFEVKSQLPTSEWQTHAMGKIGSLGHYQPERHDLEAIRRRCSTCEDTFEQRESAASEIVPLVQCSSRWECMQAIALGDNEALATLELPAAHQADLEAFQVHPALLDVATAFAIQFASKGASYLPFAYNRMRISRPFTPRIFSYVRFQPAQSATEDYLSFDVTITDEVGQELARIDGYGMKRVVNTQSPGVELKGRGYRVPSLEIDNLGSHLLSHEGVEVFRRVLMVPELRQLEICTKGIDYYLKTSENHRNVAMDVQKEEDALATRYPRPSLSTPFVAPRNPTEERIAEIWQSVLGIEAVGVHDNFIELGGHSLLAIQLTARIREAFEIELSVATLYKNPTVEGMAQAVVEALMSSLDEETINQLAVETATA
jgi:acyl transferase domain-containing protein/NAD(P)-dependent dehydrogenase (short-subunit alcohol dehydrogenase family)